MPTTLATPPPPRAANGELPPQPNQPDNPTLPNLTPDEHRIVLAFIAPGPATSPIAIAADLGIEPHTLLATFQRPQVRAWLRAAADAEDFRIELIAKRAKADALEALSEITRDKAAEPIERRRAASAVLRALRPVPLTCSEVSGSAPAGRSALRRPWVRPGSGGVTLDPADPPDPGALEAQWETDRRALRRRYDFSSSEAAAQSVARLFTEADRGDPEAALYSIFLATVPKHNLGDFDVFLAHTAHLRPAAGARLLSLEFAEDVHCWNCYRMTLQPRAPADQLPGPLDLSLWLYADAPKSPRASWQVCVICPWQNGEIVQPRPYLQGGFDSIDPTQAPDKPP
jgi:hypothetical protein